MKKLSVLIPAYNEEKTISAVLDKVLSVSLINNITKEIIVINDCSRDGTENQILEYIKSHHEADIQYVKHEINQGKGAAIHSGIAKASGDYIIIQDADLECDPEEFNLLLKPMDEGFADAVFGSRFAGGNIHRVLRKRNLRANKFLTWLTNLFIDLTLTDMETCYKLFRSEIIKNIHLTEKRFGFEPEVTIKVARVPRIKIYELSISYYARGVDDGKKIGWKDGLRAIYCILKYGLFRAK
ncbi:MAG TPA: glycosyltransferase family 2 protein [Bacteroidales bacterium]|nr:glycosyltransferase family 2 protein [Bacteroidales bacterium]HOH84799.1 glycosyltransferase family 2 protein [Bacteroidales bacterium]HPB25415.1 glycosyltransferase family 2 protein [Bacteroidales bacterium]HPI31495.1 glycosyltransferase family 2 protein [Bacteroidales bacterium]HQN15732.1 glycosyltransferase family 2 protein [Bacteroidales bacterium]